jgi:hypothetical protein
MFCHIKFHNSDMTIYKEKEIIYQSKNDVRTFFYISVSSILGYF